MSYKTEEIKEGIKLHHIYTNKFKTNLIAVFMTMPLLRETVTLETLIPSVLRRGTTQFDTQEKISIKLEGMYGAAFDCGVEKIGDNHVVKFYLETLNDSFISSSENLLKEGIELLLSIVFDPLVKDNKFAEEYVASEINNIRQLIEAKIDNKEIYSLTRCTEEMYKGENYGLYKYGYVEDLENITSDSLYQFYNKLLNESKIDIFISGDVEQEKASKILKENKNVCKLRDRKNISIINNEETEKKEKVETNEISEKMDVGQGKLVLGLDIHLNEKDSKFPISIYNVILGDSATSKLFQNVRERLSLAYSIRSNYVRQKNNIYIRSGIEIENYSKAIEVIKEQLEAIRNGDFTEKSLEDAKKYMISGINSVEDEQDSEITYYVGQELCGSLTTFSEYVDKINDVTMEDVKRVAEAIEINTIYFLKN